MMLSVKKIVDLAHKITLKPVLRAYMFNIIQDFGIIDFCYMIPI